MQMSVLQFLISPIYGCCTTGELMALSKVDKEAYNVLRKWAEDEMKRRGIDVEVKTN